jgi:hypothetical protein
MHGMAGKSDTLSMNGILPYFIGSGFLREEYKDEEKEQIFATTFWSCSPECAWTHGHISYNSTIYYSSKYGELCYFDANHKYEVTVLHSIDGVVIKKDLILEILKSANLDKDILKFLEKEG